MVRTYAEAGVDIDASDRATAALSLVGIGENAAVEAVDTPATEGGIELSAAGLGAGSSRACSGSGSCSGSGTPSNHLSLRYVFTIFISEEFNDENTINS